jgi:hypothetical protein
VPRRVPSRRSITLLAVVAVGVSLMLTGCRVVQLRYTLAVSAKPDHPVEIDLGYGYTKLWSAHGSVAPLAVALGKGRLALAWLRTPGQLQIVYRLYDHSGPCGPPDPTSAVERGRENISINCEPGNNGGAWQTLRLDGKGVRHVALAFGKTRLWVVIATDMQLRATAIDLNRRSVQEVAKQPFREVRAIYAQGRNDAASPLIAVVGTSSETELMQVSHGAFQPSWAWAKNVRELVLTPYKTGYAVGIAEKRTLTVYAVSAEGHVTRRLRMYQIAATSVALSQGGARLSFAATGHIAGRGEFMAGSVALGAPLRVDRNPQGWLVLGIARARGGTSIAVSVHDARLYANDVLDRKNIRAFTTVRWNTHTRRFEQVQPADGLAGVGASYRSAMLVMGGISQAGHATHSAYLLSSQ